MRWVGVALLVLVAGCTGTPSAAVQADAPASAGRTASQPRTDARPPAGDLPLVTVGFSCRLPISTPDGQGAFISFPARKVAIDPDGSKGQFYDRAYSRWLPVSRNSVSPDGKRYAAVEGASIRLVDLAGGVEHRFQLPAISGSGGYVVVDYATEGVYLGQSREAFAGLWLLDTGTGAVARVATLSGFQVHGTEREFWVGSINHGDPHPVEGMEPQPDQVDRLDLSDGYREAWLYRPGAAVNVIGLDEADHPIVRVTEGSNGLVAAGSAAELVLLLAPGDHRSLFKGQAALLSTIAGPEADDNGIWFGSQQGIYLYTASGGLQKVSSQPGYPAGFCV